MLIKNRAVLGVQPSHNWPILIEWDYFKIIVNGQIVQSKVWVRSYKTKVRIK